MEGKHSTNPDDVYPPGIFLTALQPNQRFSRAELKWLHDKCSPLDAYLCYEAATHTNAATRKHLAHALHEWRCPWDERTPRALAVNNDWELLQYCTDHGCPYHARDLGSECAIRGYDSLLRRLMQHGFDVDELGCALEAVEEGHVDVLDLAYTHCPIALQTYVHQEASQSPHEAVQRWASQIAN